MALPAPRYTARLTILLLLCGLGQFASAGPTPAKLEQRLTPEQMHETGLDTLSPQQLSRLNQLLQAQAASERASNPPPAGVKYRDAFAGLDDAPITTRLKGSISQWQPGTEFQLENGQTWRVLKGSMTLRKPMDRPAILLVPGIAGRWFLQVHEDFPKARVYRID